MEDMPQWLGVLISWFPMLLLIAVWVVFMSRMSGAGKRGRKYQEDVLEEMRKQNALLERITLALERRSPA